MSSVSEKNRQTGVKNTAGPKYKRKEAAQKRTKYVPKNLPNPRGPATPEPHVAIVPARHRDGSASAAAVPIDQDVLPVDDRRREVPILDGGELPHHEFLLRHDDIGIPDAPQFPAPWRNRHVCPSSSDHQDEVVAGGRLLYHFTRDIRSLFLGSGEILARARTTASAGAVEYVTGVIVLLVLIACAPYLPIRTMYTVLCFVFGIGAVVYLGLNFPVEYRRTLEYRHVRFDRTDPRARVFQDQTRVLTVPYATFVNVNITVDVVYWDGTQWLTLPPWIGGAVSRLPWAEVYMPRRFEVPHHLWASVIATISRLADRTEEQVQISVDQAVRSMRAHVPLNYQLEFEGMTGNLSVASMHAYRAMKYRNSENWTPAR